MTVPTVLDERFRAAAAAAGDARRRLRRARRHAGRARCSSASRTAGSAASASTPSPSAELERLARQFGPRVLRSPKAVDRVRRELDEYFAGRRHAFDLELDLRVHAGLPPARARGARTGSSTGTTTTYGALAAQVGAPRAARAVGTVMNRNPLPIVLPCHRVVGANGSLTGYGGGLDRKEWLLRLEGALL